MSVINTQPLIGASGNQGGYKIERSLRFKQSAGSKLSRTFGTPTTQNTWTISAWVKRAGVYTAGTPAYNLGPCPTGGNYQIFFYTDDRLSFYNGSSYVFTTNQSFRDPAAWYHIMIAVDSAASGTNKCRLYVNGSEVTSFNVDNRASFTSSPLNSAIEHRLGEAGAGGNNFDGYLADYYFIDGQQLTPSSFGEFDTITGLWKPKKYIGTYGNNGFYLPFNTTSLNLSSYAASFNGSTQYLTAGTTATNFLATGSTTGITATIEAWVAPTAYYSGANPWQFSPIYAKGTTYFNFGVNNGKLRFYWYDGAYQYVETASTLDVPLNSWTHVAVTLNGSAIKLYVNGVAKYTGTWTGLNTGGLNGTEYIGSERNLPTYFTGQISNLRVSNAVIYSADFTPSTSALTSSSSTKLLTLQNSTIIDNSSNAFTITNNGSVATSVQYPFTINQLFKDQSSRGNHWLPSNISLIADYSYDSMTDVPTLTSETAANYCVLNQVQYTVASTYSEAGLRLSNAGNNWYCATGTMGMTSGKWYWETTTMNPNEQMHGIISTTQNLALSWIGMYASGYAYYNLTGNVYNNNTGTTYGASWTTGDIIGIAFDADARTLTFYKNGVSQGVAYSSIPAGTYVPGFSLQTYAGQAGNNVIVNFGQRPFAYTPPTGFKALNTYNLPDSTIKAGNKVMDATVYTGTGSALTVTNTGGFKPDFVWVKGRSAATSHILQDSVRGAGKSLVSNSTGAETGTTGDLISSFNSNGFTVNTNLNGGTDPSTDLNGAAYVGWQWQAGQGTTSSNTAGSITSTVSVNPSAGFSVVKYTGTGASATVGHGLGVAPSMIIVKSLGVEDWFVYHVSLGGSPPGYLKLNTTGANGGGSSAIFPSSPTSAVINIGSGSGVGANGVQHIAYCWTPVPGFSSFGYYTGNGSADGPFVYTGFRPKFILIKNSSDAGAYWAIWDSSRDPYNPEYHSLFPNVSDAEVTNTNILDGVSNGFKIRTTATYVNTNGNGIIYAAFAENPFKNSLAR